MPPGTAEYWLLATAQIGAIDLHRLNLEKTHAVIDSAVTAMLAGDWSRGKECRGFCATFLGD